MLAIRQHRHRLARHGAAEPPALAELEQLLLGLRRGQLATRAATLLDDCDAADREWLTRKEAAQVTGLSVRAIERAIASGELASARVGRSRRIHRAAIAQLLEDGA